MKVNVPVPAREKNQQAFWWRLLFGWSRYIYVCTTHHCLADFSSYQSYRRHWLEEHWMEDDGQE